MLVHGEEQRSHRIGWRRAAVHAAKDGIISTASLIVGVAAAQPSHSTVLVAGIGGLVAGAMSLAAGEYVTARSQSDAERADLARERQELATTPGSELEELRGIYVSRGLDPELARRVAEQLTAHDALEAHARDELGISVRDAAPPERAATVSAAAFAVGAALPLGVAVFAPMPRAIPFVSVLSLLFLGAIGGLAARAGGTSVVRGAVRQAFWGALAMAATMAVERAFGGVV